MLRFPALAALGLLAAVPAAAQTGAATTASAPRTMTRSAMLADVQKKFTGIDTNHDKVVTKTEIQAAETRAMAELGKMRDEQMAENFKKLDTDNNGQISLTEFKAIAPDLKASETPDQILTQYDTNKDGKITLDEYRSPQSAMFDKLDSNRDGTLTQQEVASARKGGGGR